MISIKKGLLGGTGKSVLAKLAIDVWNKAEDFYKFFKGLPGNNFFIIIIK